MSLVMAAVSRVAGWFWSWSSDPEPVTWVPTEAAGEVETLADQLELMALERDEARDRALARRAQVAELRALLDVAQAELSLDRAELAGVRGQLEACREQIRELRARERGWQRDRDQLAACREQITELEQGREVEDAARTLLAADRVRRIAELEQQNEALNREWVAAKCRVAALKDQQEALRQTDRALEQARRDLVDVQLLLAERTERLTELERLLGDEMRKCAELAERADDTEDRLTESARDQRQLEDELGRARTALVELCRGLGVGQVGASESELAQAALGAARVQGERVGKLRDAAITTVRKLEDLANAWRSWEDVDPAAVERQASLLMQALAADARDHRTRVGDTEPNEALAPPPVPSPAGTELPWTASDGIQRNPPEPKSWAGAAAALINDLRRKQRAAAESSARAELPSEECQPSSVEETQARQASSSLSIASPGASIEVSGNVSTEHCTGNGLTAGKVAKVGHEPSIQESGENKLECNCLQSTLCGNCAPTERGVSPGHSGKVDR